MKPTRCHGIVDRVRWAMAAVLIGGAVTAAAWGQLIPTPGPVMAVAGGAGPAQPEPPPRWPHRDRSKGITLGITPQLLARPALQYQLLPPIEDTEAGNPAVLYLEAATEMPALKDGQSELLDAADKDAPLAELDEKDPALKEILDGYGYTMKMVHRAARTDGLIDWQNRLREQGYIALLPSLGKYRQMANLLCLQIRLDIKKHNWAAACDKLQTGFGMARHMTQGQTIIESLVGVAIASLMCNMLEDWVQEPGAPNLYWPLANLPAPFADLQRPMAFERATWYFSFPEMKEFKQGKFSAGAWPALYGHMMQMQDMTEASPSLKVQLTAAGLGTLMYPQAKSYLVEHGTDAAAVEKMPVYEALERYFLLSLQDEADDMYKWNGLPAKLAAEGMAAAEKEMEARRQRGGGNMLVEMLLPSLARVRVITARVDRQIAALRIVEAIRGREASVVAGDFVRVSAVALPDKLADLQLPIPIDAVRDAPFEYTMQGGKAVLVSPAATPREGLRYEITLRTAALP